MIQVTVNTQDDANTLRASLLKKSISNFNITVATVKAPTAPAAKTTKKPYVYVPHKLTDRQKVMRIAMRMAKESAMAGNGSKTATHFLNPAHEELKACRF
jgi:hypothetical protein